MTPPAPHEHPNQFALLKQRRFAPFFWTQFSGAANDNLFKFAFTVMVTYQVSVSWLPPALAGLVIGALFILPFLLFSATSGQLADKLESVGMRRELVRWPLQAYEELAAEEDDGETDDEEDDEGSRAGLHAEDVSMGDGVLV